MTSSVKVKVENFAVLCSYAYTYVCQIFKDIWLSHFQIILNTKKWVEIRKINK